MNKQNAIDWLNHRVAACNASNHLTFDDSDINFIQMYVNHYKNSNIEIHQVINSLRNNFWNSNKLLAHLDFMATKLIMDFNIQTETDPHPHVDVVIINGVVREETSYKIIRYY